MKKLLTVLLIFVLSIGILPSDPVLARNKVNLKPTWDNIYLLAKAMWAENRGSSDEAVFLTGIVVCQRVRANCYPDTIKGVLSQKGQYATWINGQIQSCEPDERCIELAEEILRFKLYKDYPHNLVFQAQFKQGIKVYKYFKKYGEYFCLA